MLRIQLDGESPDYLLSRNSEDQCGYPRKMSGAWQKSPQARSFGCDHRGQAEARALRQNSRQTIHVPSRANDLAALHAPRLSAPANGMATLRDRLTAVSGQRVTLPPAVTRRLRSGRIVACCCARAAGPVTARSKAPRLEARGGPSRHALAVAFDFIPVALQGAHAVRSHKHRRERRDRGLVDREIDLGASGELRKRCAPFGVPLPGDIAGVATDLAERCLQTASQRLTFACPLFFFHDGGGALRFFLPPSCGFRFCLALRGVCCLLAAGLGFRKSALVSPSGACPRPDLPAASRFLTPSRFASPVRERGCADLVPRRISRSVGAEFAPRSAGAQRTYSAHRRHRPRARSRLQQRTAGGLRAGHAGGLRSQQASA